MIEISRDQALAFIESLTGWIDLSEQNQTPKSPHALTCLQAVIGATRVGTVYDFQGLYMRLEGSPPNRFIDEERVARASGTLVYLAAVVQALTPRQTEVSDATP